MPFIMVTVLLDMMSIGIVVPVLPKLVELFMSGRADMALAYRDVQVSFAVAQFFSAAILGALSDRYGRRPVLLLGMLGLALSFLVTYVATAFWVLVVIRFFAGIMCANIAVANAYVADITEPENRARNYGLLGAMMGIGFILGPVTGGLLGNDNPRLPFLIAGVLCLINCVYGYFVLPESLKPEQRRPFRLISPFQSLARLRRIKGIEPLLWLMGLSTLAQFTLHSAWLMFTQFRFGWSPRDNGLSLFVVGITAAVSQALLMKQLQKVVSVPTVAVLSMLSCTLAFFAWGAVFEPWMLYAVAVVNIVGYMLVPSLQSLISNKLPMSSQGEGMGAVASINSVAAVLGPLMSGSLLATVSHLAPSDWRMGTPFYACALIQAVALVIGLVYLSRQLPVPDATKA